MVDGLAFMMGALLIFIGAMQLCSVIYFLAWQGTINNKVSISRQLLAGLLIIGFVVLTQRYSQLPRLVYLMLFLPLLFDAIFSYLRHLYTGYKWSESCHKYAFQRLYQAGWSKTKILLGLTIISLLSLACIIASAFYPAYINSFLIIDLIVVSYAYYCIECITTA